MINDEQKPDRLTEHEIRELRAIVDDVRRKRAAMADKQQRIVADSEYERREALGQGRDGVTPLSSIMKKVGSRWIAKK